jgi:hypothetical protein
VTKSLFKVLNRLRRGEEHRWLEILTSTSQMEKTWLVLEIFSGVGRVKFGWGLQFFRTVQMKKEELKKKFEYQK